MNKEEMRRAVSEFIKLPEEKLREMVKDRLNGKPSVFMPVNEMMGEHPADILLSIYDFEGDEEFKSNFNNVLISLLNETLGNLTNVETKYFRRLISLIGRLEIVAAHDCVKSLFVESRNIDKESLNHKAILIVLESLEKHKA